MNNIDNTNSNLKMKIDELTKKIDELSNHPVFTDITSMPSTLMKPLTSSELEQIGETMNKLKLCSSVKELLTTFFASDIIKEVLEQARKK